jgi:cystathionine gamma-synthase
MAETERALGPLDGGDALLFASGSAACTSILLGLLAPGQTVALAEGAYYGTGTILDELARWGIGKVEFDQTGPPPDDVDLVWLEAPSNPFLTLPNFEAAAAHPARVVCDSTAATPLNVRPLAVGCDLALHSATKYLSGHDDALAGVVVCKEPGDAARLLEFRSRTGPVPSADTAWLVARGLKTLEVRMARQTESTRELALRLSDHTAVSTVRYPGFGGLLSFDVADAAAAQRVETSTRLFVNATSLGGVTSRIESRARWEGNRVPPGLLRIAVGLEDPNELWADLEQALARS